jgi:hypothetical protein
MSSASPQEKLVTRRPEISITRTRRRTAGGHLNTARRARRPVRDRRRPRSWSREHRESRSVTNPQWSPGAVRVLPCILRTILPMRRKASRNRRYQPAKSGAFASAKRPSPHDCFTGGISAGSRRETSDPTDDVVRTGQRPRVHQAGWLAPSGGGRRVDHVPEPVHHGLARQCGAPCRGGNVTATLNSCAVGLVHPEFSEPRL